MMFAEMPGFPGYFISDDGFIWSTHFGTMKRLKSYASAHGYKKFSRMVGNVKKRIYVHRAVWIAFNGDIPEGMEINHKDRRRDNNALDNLELLTHAENVRYSAKARRAERNLHEL